MTGGLDVHQNRVPLPAEPFVDGRDGDGTSINQGGLNFCASRLRTREGKRPDRKSERFGLERVLLKDSGDYGIIAKLKRQEIRSQKLEDSGERRVRAQAHQEGNTHYRVHG